MKAPTVKELLERRANWVENECDFVECEVWAACPFCVYDREGNPKCDSEARRYSGCE